VLQDKDIMDNEDAIIDGEGDLARVEDLDAALEPDRGLDPEGELAEEDLAEVELDGQVYAVPAALKGAFLRQADYTRKTQELAEHRRAVEAERQALAEQKRAAAGASQDRLRLAALDHQLETFQGVDWEAYAAEDPQAAQALWGRFQALNDARGQLAYAVSHEDEREQLKEAREAAERMAQTGQKLREEIDGWSPDVAAKLIEYGQAFGVTVEELAQMADARLWKLLHKAYQADQAGQQQTAARAQAVRPAVMVGGAAAGSGGVRDELATKEWMARRNDQMLKGR
jgi:hypothetical protein